jgi:SAM-dependent methyltransferase
MKLRLELGRFVSRLGRFIDSLTVVVMRPDNLIEYSRRQYTGPYALYAWGDDSLLNQGLFPGEKDLLAQVPLKSGRLLLLGVGGGRDAIPLARMGFEVVGVDYIEDMVEKAKRNAARHGVTLQGLVQEISQLEVPPGSFDLAVLSQAMYSCTPTRTRRVQMLKRIHTALKPGGYFLCQFILDPSMEVSRKVELARKAFGLLTWGNRWYEKGDMLWGSGFMHIFLSEDELRSEFAAGGFEVIYFPPNEFGTWRGAVLRRPNSNLEAKPHA